MRKLPKTHKTVLRQSGRVQLVKLERFDCDRPLYGVSAPYKISGLDGPIVCEQFMTEAEAIRAYARYVKWFERGEQQAGRHDG